MAVDFYLADNLKDTSNSEEHLHFSERLQNYLLTKYHKTDPVNSLTGLDPYGDRLFETEEIKTLMEICKQIKEDQRPNDEVCKFCENMIAFCNLALKKGEKIYAVGD